MSDPLTLMQARLDREERRVAEIESSMRHLMWIALWKCIGHAQSVKAIGVQEEIANLIGGLNFRICMLEIGMAQIAGDES